MTNTQEPNVTIKPETSSDKKRIIKISECPTLSGCPRNHSLPSPLFIQHI